MSQRLRAIICALLDHSRIQTAFFGYFYCGRCGAQVGDSLGGVYDSSRVVVIDHCCDTCRENYRAMTWKDRLLVRNPFGGQA